MIKGPQKIKKYMFISWLIAGAIALSASLTLFLALGLYSHTKANESAIANLTEKGNKAARRLSAELLLEDRGSPDSVKKMLENDLGIEGIEVLKSGLIFHPIKGKVSVEIPVPNLEQKFKIVVSNRSIPFREHFNFVLLICCISLIAIIVIAGLWLQSRYLRKHLVNPIESLVDTSTGEKFTNENWPIELQEISEKLNQSFREREQVVYSQVARGVIHDIRTLLQAIQSATDLAVEKQSEERYKNLLNISKSKLPSLLSIINTALDGSREIMVKPIASDLTKTLANSIETTRALDISKNVKFKLIDLPSSKFVVHDTVQLERVFTNILKNAVEAIEIKQSELKTVEIGISETENHNIRITIEDNGVGLPVNPESVFRLLKSTKAHGSGLGLLVSRKIVEAHGGSLVASQSKVLGGAKFEIQFPQGSQP